MRERERGDGENGKTGESKPEGDVAMRESVSVKPSVCFPKRIYSYPKGESRGMNAFFPVDGGRLVWRWMFLEPRHFKARDLCSPS